MLNYVNSYRYKTGIACDPDFANVVLLLPLNGSNNSTTFTDVSYYGRTVTRNGDVKIVNTQSKWGGSSAQFDGNGDYLFSGPSADFNLTGGNFTVEFWVYFNSLSGIPHPIQFGSSLSNRWNILVNNNIFVLWVNNGTVTSSAILSTPKAINQWYHVAVVKSGSTTTLYINGLAEGSATNIAWPTGNLSVAIGTQQFTPISGDWLNGFIDDLRITKGTARYTGNFSVPNTAFPMESCYGANITSQTFTAPLSVGTLSINTINAPGVTAPGFAGGNLSINTINAPVTTNPTLASGNLSINTLNTPSVFTPVFVGV